MTPSSTRSPSFAAAASAVLLLAGCATAAPRPTPPAKATAEAKATAPGDTGAATAASRPMTVGEIKAKLDEALRTNDPAHRVALLAEVYPQLPPGSGIRGFVAGILVQGYADDGNLEAMARVAKDVPLGDDLPTADMLNAMAYAYGEAGSHLTEAYVRVDQALRILDHLERQGGGQGSERRAKALRTRRGAYLDTEGWVLLKLGETNDAVKDLTRAAALLDASEVHYHLGEALLKQGHVEKAARHLARAVALGGDGAKSAKAALEKLRGQVDVDKLLDEARKASAASAAAQQQAARLQVLQHAVSQPLPTFAATTLKGRPLDTRELGQGHVAVVWFWATWCRPCLAELPHMESLYAHYQGEGVRFLGVSVDGDLSAVRHFLDKRGTTVPWVTSRATPAPRPCTSTPSPRCWSSGPRGASATGTPATTRRWSGSSAGRSTPSGTSPPPGPTARPRRVARPAAS